MKTLIYILCLLVVSNPLWAHIHGPQGEEKSIPDTLREINLRAFQPGERLDYVLHYGIINAGVATLTVKESEHKIYDRSLLHVVGTGRSVGAFNWFFKVRDRYESYIDREGIFPWVFVRRVNEGGFIINQDYKFFQHQKKVDNGKGEEFPTPEYVQDMLSAFYYGRTINFDTAKIGDTFVIPSFVDNEVWPLRIKYMGKETIGVRGGKFRCMRFVPVVQEGRIFKDDEDLSVWITDDKNRIPVLAKASVLVGSIKMELTDFSGLANPVAKLK